MSREPEPGLRTNWSIVPANDNRPEEYREDLEVVEPEPILIECIHEIRPRESELIRAVGNVEWREFRHANRRGGERDKMPITGDIETRPVDSPLFSRLDKVVRLGDLRLGTLPTEDCGSATLPGNDRQIIAWRGRRPVDRFTAAKGHGVDEDEERAKRERLAGWLGCEAGWHVTATKESRAAARARGARVRGLPTPPLPPTSLPLDEARAFAGLPPAATTDKRAGLPLGSPDIGNIFASWISAPKKGKSGSVATDESGPDRTSIEAHLSKDDVVLLDAAITAQNFEEVGAVIGVKGKTAERRGKAELVGAVARLANVLEELAA
ncbi:hypothetical protein [Shinella sp.]|uniref:hypothetical protein n=1 Tax=Shinella sp. TaxID=1870904 RepID=UPI004036FD98